MHSNMPAWVVLHLPHASTTIPDDVRAQFLLDNEDLNAELDVLTDQHVRELFENHEPLAQPVAADVSRLVVDLERFTDDARETAAQHGFGAIYEKTTTGAALRRPLTGEERLELLQRHAAHHERLTAIVEATLDEHGRCLLLDCHTFPDRRMPFEVGDPNAPRPDICIGTDPWHTPSGLRDALVEQFEAAGWSTALDRPFAGTVVPERLYHSDRRLAAVMIDANRRIVDGSTPTPQLTRRFRGCLHRALSSWQASASPAEHRARTASPGRCR
jgi:N-formylglutamate amidohydrolase